MHHYELLRLLEFSERICSQFSKVGDRDDGAARRIILALVICEIQQRPVTVTTLVVASGLSHGTAIRRITAMIDGGLILRLPTRENHNRNLLRPSPELIKRVEEVASEIKGFLADALGSRSKHESVEDYVFNITNSPVIVNPPLSLLRRKMPKRRPLKFLLNDDNYFSSMRQMWCDFRSDLGSASDFRLVDQKSLYAEAVDNCSAENPNYDIVSIDMPWLGEFAEKSLIAPIGNSIRKNGVNPLDFNPVVWSSSTWKGEPMGVPAYCTMEVLAARKDVFESHSRKFPRSFDDVISAGRRFHRPERNQYGIGWNARRGMPIASSFMVFLGCCDAAVLPFRRVSSGGWVARPDLIDVMPELENDCALETLDYMHRLLEISNPNAIQMDWNEICAEFMRGRSAMCYVWSMRATQFETDPRSVVSTRVSYLPQPASSGGRNNTPVGGFLLCIPSNIGSERYEMAMEALSWLSSREAMRFNMMQGLPITPRFSMATELESRRHSSLVKAVSFLANRNLLATWQRPAFRFYSQMEAVLGEEIHDAMLRRKTDRQALNDAQRRIEAAIALART